MGEINSAVSQLPEIQRHVPVSTIEEKRMKAAMFGVSVKELGKDSGVVQGGEASV
jgi:hypothetical protein